MLYRCGGSDPVSPRRVAGEYKVGKGDIVATETLYLEVRNSLRIWRFWDEISHTNFLQKTRIKKIKI